MRPRSSSLCSSTGLFGSFWIDFGLAVWAGSLVLGLTVLAPTGGRIHRLIVEHGAGDPLVEGEIRTLLRLARIDVAMLLLVVIDMAAKPSF